MSTPLVSVIVPVYNGARFLAAALDSVLAQIYTHYELIVVDDGSTDESAAIAGRYPAARVISQTNRGTAGARNVGLTIARGELIAFLDQDDLWLPEKLRTQVDRHLAEPELGYTLTRLHAFLEPGDAWPTTLKRDQTEGFFPSCWMVRAATFAQIGHFDQDFAYAEDYEWLSRARDAGVPTTMLDETLVLRRIHGLNQSRHVDRALPVLLRIAHRSIARKRTGYA
ncbi:MAG TPA: glycosyltransferase family A protein [Thermomicrobiales bacterium]